MPRVVEIGVLCGLMAGPGVAQEQEIPVATEEPANAPTLVDTRFLLTGDWNGERSKLAEAGLTFDVQWTQSAQGVVSGGRDTGWEYGGSV
ncbi:MAG: hypothetical protein ACYTGC_06475, partial [Planctomycetota bacterium]